MFDRTRPLRTIQRPFRPRSTRERGIEKGAKCEARSGHIFCWPLPPQLLQVSIFHLVPVPSQEVHLSERSAVPHTRQRLP
jgi:hypothetical protein